MDESCEKMSSTKRRDSEANGGVFIRHFRIAYRGLFSLSDEKLEIYFLRKEGMLFDLINTSFMVPETSLRIGIKQFPDYINGIGTHIRRKLHLAFNNLLKYNLQPNRSVSYNES